MSSQSMIILCNSLQNREVVEIVKRSIKNGYLEFFIGHSDEISNMLDIAFDKLVQSQSDGFDVNKLHQTSRFLVETVFKKSDETFWYNQIYRSYKHHIQPEGDFQKIKPYLLGNTILDFGCGGGYLALQMERNGFTVFTTDVMDYRFSEARHIPFMKMGTPTEILLFENKVETVVVQTVLHHIDGENIPVILNSLSKIANRLLLKEDIFDLSQIPESHEMILNQPLLYSFSNLSLESQFQVLALCDYFANAIALGIPEMNLPFQFRSISGWTELLEKNGWQLTEAKLIGFEQHRMHATCQAWMVFDRLTD